MQIFPVKYIIKFEKVFKREVAPEDTVIPDPNAVPNTVPSTVETLQYEEIEEEVIPAGPVTPSGSVVIPEEEVPLAPTGGIPAGLFYGAGASCIVTAIVISGKKGNKKNG